jgi:hypothetical protein
MHNMLNLGDTRVVIRIILVLKIRRDDLNHHLIISWCRRYIRVAIV